MKMILVSSLLLFTGVIFAADFATLPEGYQAITDEQIDELAWSHTWRSLLRAKPGSSASKVVSSDFFLSQAGKDDLVEELKSSIEIFFSDDSPNREQTICRFPARYTWLRRELVDAEHSDSFERCVDYWQWSGEGQTESISLFYANGYFENPASFFGHVLIRLNEHKDADADELLATAIDYGARIPPEDRGLRYILKGVFGFYDASFSDANFYRHNHNYGNDQFRDLWEYRLPLSAQQVEFMTLHLWELMSVRQTYFFMTENCGTAVNDLLQIVDLGIHPDDRVEPWFLPVDIFVDPENLTSSAGSAAVTRFKPSILSVFHTKFDALSKHDKRQFSKIVRNQNLDEVLIDVELDRAQFIDLLLSYYEIRMAKEYWIEESKAMQQKLLLARLALPAAVTKSQTYFDPELFSEPHYASPSSTLRVSGFTEGTDRVGVTVRYRPVQFDSLGLNNARPEHAHLAILDTEVEFSEGKWALRNLDLLRIRSLNSTKTYLPADWPISWEFRIRAGEKLYDCDPSCFNASAEAGAGKSITFKDGVTGYVLANIGYQSSTLGFDNVFVKPTIGMLYDTYRDTKFGVEYFREYTEGRDRSVFRFDVRQQINKHYDLRLSYENEEIERYELGLSYFF